jgi:hypothetical protein
MCIYRVDYINIGNSYSDLGEGFSLIFSYITNCSILLVYNQFCPIWNENIEEILFGMF